MCDVERFTVRLPSSLTARELDNAASPLDYLGERVAYDALAPLAPPRTAKADFVRFTRVTGELVTKENKEWGWLIFHTGSIAEIRGKRKLYFFFFSANPACQHEAHARLPLGQAPKRCHRWR